MDCPPDAGQYIKKFQGVHIGRRGEGLRQQPDKRLGGEKLVVDTHLPADSHKDRRSNMPSWRSKQVPKRSHSKL